MIEQCYRWDPYIGQGSKELACQEGLVVPNVGTGTYDMESIMSEGFKSSVFVDVFATKDPLNRMSRERSDKRVGNFSSSAIEVSGPAFEGKFGYIDAENSGTRFTFNVGQKEIYRAFYGSDGRLTKLSTGMRDEASLIFEFDKNIVTGLSDNSIVEPDLDRRISAEKEIRYNDRFFAIRQDSIGILVAISKVGYVPYEGLVKVTTQILAVPEQVDMESMRFVILKDSTDWLQISEHLPVRYNIAKENKRLWIG